MRDFREVVVLYRKRKGVRHCPDVLDRQLGHRFTSPARSAMTRTRSATTRNHPGRAPRGTSYVKAVSSRTATWVPSNFVSAR
ncbi:MAG: hypothetical protein DMD81_27055 [Candidatus Rokuibacteriota bacterium]|nr:MAG: hypothetical protein DMD81_27055 [Candidatus Rokubacteria bacterium]